MERMRAALKKHLSEWVSEKLISAEQSKSIQKYEHSKPASNWIVRAFMMIGALVIGIGVISIVAANWYLTPASVKLGGNFICLGILAYFIYKFADSKKTNVLEILLVVMMITCLASIGLISQVYHTGGKLQHALLFWSIISGSTDSLALKL